MFRQPLWWRAAPTLWPHSSLVPVIPTWTISFPKKYLKVTEAADSRSLKLQPKYPCQLWLWPRGQAKTERGPLRPLLSTEEARLVLPLLKPSIIKKMWFKECDICLEIVEKTQHTSTNNFLFDMSECDFQKMMMMNFFLVKLTFLFVEKTNPAGWTWSTHIVLRVSVFYRKKK